MRTMSAGIPFKPGQVVLVPFPFSDLSGVKKRPALVLSTAEFNSRHDDLICCMVTSHLDGEAGCPVVSQRDMASGNLVFESKIKPYRLFTVDKGVVIKTLGVLGPKKLKETLQLLPPLFGFFKFA